MENLKKFSAYINESWNKFKRSSIQWTIKPKEWKDVRNSLLLSHLTDSQRTDLIENHIINNIYDSVKYDIINPNDDFIDIWCGESSPQFLVVRCKVDLGLNYYLIDTQGYDYAKFVVRLDDLEKWVNIENNLFNG